MNAEFVAKVRHRCRRDLLSSARMGWLLYPCGFFLGYLSGMPAFNPRLYYSIGVGFTILLLLRFWFYRRSEESQHRMMGMMVRVFLASALWGILATYGAAHANDLTFPEVLHFGSLAIVGIGGLVMYTPVYAMYLMYMSGYCVTFSVGQFFWGGSDKYAVMLSSFIVQAGLVWVGRRQHLAHSRAVVSSLLLERRARELESAYRKLELSSSHRVQFMQSLSAELHSSLDGINRVSEFLKQTPLGDEQLRLVETARRTTRDLVQYLEGVSEISALESGKAEFFQDQIYLPRTLGGLLEELSQQALLSGRSFVYRLQPGLPDVVLTDRHRLQQLVRIMAENCLRMTDAGGMIRLHAEWCENVSSSDSGHLLLRFTDTGVGMDTAQIRNLIEDAYLAQNEVESPLRGASLHFALLGRILFRMHGQFKVESLSEVGNAYEITLPLKIVMWRSQTGEELEAGFDSLGLDEDDLPRILLVDDNVLHQHLMAKLCIAWGYSLEIAASGPQALQWFELRHFDLVLIDVLMPQLDCHETLRCIRERATLQNTHIPVVGLSNDFQEEGQRASAAAGVDAFVAKPFAPDLLYRIISDYLHSNSYPHA